MVYQWKPLSCLKADAQEVGEQMEWLEANGGLTPSRLLDANRQVGTPLHNDFEWDDTTAAEKYREGQAQYVIRHITVTQLTGANDPVTVRAFVNTVQNSERIYLSTAKVLSDKELRCQMLETAKAELLAFKTKYDSLEELASVFSVIDEVTA